MNQALVRRGLNKPNTTTETIMDKYIITERVTLHSGVLCITDEQVKHRERSLKKVMLRKNCYEIIGPVQFKVGEEIGYEGDMPKKLALNLTEKSKFEAAAKKAAAEADKEAAKEAEKAAAKQAEEAAKARAKLEAEAEAEWKSNAQLREQHGNDFAAFMAGVLEQLG